MLAGSSGVAGWPCEPGLVAAAESPRPASATTPTGGGGGGGGAIRSGVGPSHQAEPVRQPSGLPLGAGGGGGGGGAVDSKIVRPRVASSLTGHACVGSAP